VMEKSVTVLDRLSDVAMKLNGLDRGTVEEAEKNS
jgi:hypothetical protein